MGDSMGAGDWASSESYGRRYGELNERLARSPALMDCPFSSKEEAAELRYRLTKLAIAAEDIRTAIAAIEHGRAGDATVAEAVVELRNACGEIMDSFSEANDGLVSLLNFLAE